MTTSAVLTTGHVSDVSGQGVPCSINHLDDLRPSLFPEPPPRSPRRALSHRSLTPSKLSIETPLSPIVDSAVELEDETDDMVDEGYTSDASSICHSPSWSDYGVAEKKRKQKKKEAKVAQKELEKQEKQKLKDSTHRPRRLSKAQPQPKQVNSRPATAPAIPIRSFSTERPSLPLSHSPGKVSTQNIVRADTMPICHVDESSSVIAPSASERFVGGLKLQQLNGKNAQLMSEQYILQQNECVDTKHGMIPPPLRLSSNLQHDIEPTLPGSSHSSDSFNSMSVDMHSREYDQESYASRIAREPSLLEKLSQDNVGPNSSRYRSRSQRYTTLNTSGASLRGRSSTSQSPAQFSFVSSIAPTLKHDNDLAEFNFQSPQMFGGAKNHFQIQEEDVDLSPLDSDDEEETNYHSFITSAYLAPELATDSKNLETVGGVNTAPNLVSRPSFSGFRQRARTAFAKRNGVSSNSVASATISQLAVDRPSSSSSASKIERMFGVDPASPSSIQTIKTLPPSSISGSSMSDISTTDASEGRPSSEHQSDITTPTSSRSHSRQPYDRVQQQFVDISQSPNLEHKDSEKAMLNLLQDDIKPRMPNIPPRMNSAVKIERRPPVSRSLQIEPMADDTSFLPELKNQAMAIRSAMKAEVSRTSPIKEKRQVVNRNSQGSLARPVSKRSPASSAYLRDARLFAPHTHSILQHSPGFHAQKMSTNTNFNDALPNANEAPIAKMFVICCGCKFFHDLPSKIYEAMASGPSVVQDNDLGVSGVIKTKVSCPWCQHGMSADCCAGYAGIVYLHERFH